jgi:hypothetical protein
MVCAFLGLGREVVKVGQDDPSQIVEHIGHSTLEGSDHIFQTEWHHTVGKGAPWCHEGSFILVPLADSDLMITGKPIHERHDFMTDASIDNLIDERSREVFFETCLVEILEVGAYPNGTMLFVNRDRVRYP